MNGVKPGQQPERLREWSSDLSAICASNGVVSTLIQM
jgi:hypothetical protein